MRSINSRLTSTAAIGLVLALLGGCAASHRPVDPAEAGSRTTPATDQETARARERLTDLLASEEITRIDFEAQTYEEALTHLHAVADAIIELNRSDAGNMTALVDQASAVIEAFNAHSPRGLAMTFGKNVKEINVRNAHDARMLGEMLGRATSLIRQQLGQEVSYRDPAKHLFRSVLIDPELESMLVQYLDGIQRVADLPAARRGRYFH